MGIRVTLDITHANDPDLTAVLIYQDLDDGELVEVPNSTKNTTFLEFTAIP